MNNRPPSLLTARPSTPEAAAAPVQDAQLATIELRKHDRLNLEIKLEHPAPDATEERVESLVDLWFFLPPAIGITTETYGSADFYGDLRAYTRLKTPAIPLSELARVDGPRSPLATLATIREELPTGPMPRQVGQMIRGEARLLCCMLRRSSRDIHRLLAVTPSPGLEPLCTQVVEHAQQLLASWRTVCTKLRASRLDPRTRDALQTCDEALSLEVEALASRILLDHGDAIGDGSEELAELATTERRLRSARGDRSGAHPSADGADTRADFWDQASLLKKYVSQALFLVARENSGQKTLEHLAKAFAAALAMAWTVALQVATVLLLGLELNSQVDVRMVVLFSLIAVGGYILKDRIKDTVGKRLASAIPRLLYDRRLDLFRKDDTLQLGQVQERVRFAGVDDAPRDVRTLRVVTARTPLVLHTDAHCLHYQRRVVTFPRQGTRTFARLVGLTDILRVNLAAWTRTLDRRRKSVAMVSDDGLVSVEEVPNRYLVDVVARISSPTDDTVVLQAWRLVLTRRGLVRVEVSNPLED